MKRDVFSEEVRVCSNTMLSFGKKAKFLVKMERILELSG